MSGKGHGAWGRSSRVSRTAGWRVLAVCAAVAGCPAVAGCAGRQAVVESDPRGGAEARRRLEATARSDLDALRRAQTDRLEQTGAYTYDLAALGVEGSPGVDLSVLEATASGFSALAAAGSVECALFVGDADPPRAYTVTAGVVACRA